jgi:hypothetical protein
MTLGCYAAGCMKLLRTTKSQADVSIVNTSHVERLSVSRRSPKIAKELVLELWREMMPASRRLF